MLRLPRACRFSLRRPVSTSCVRLLRVAAERHVNGDAATHRAWNGHGRSRTRSTPRTTHITTTGDMHNNNNTRTQDWRDSYPYPAAPLRHASPAAVAG